MSDDEKGPAEYDDSDEEVVARESVMSIERQSHMLEQQNHQHKPHDHQPNAPHAETKEEAYTQVVQTQTESRLNVQTQKIDLEHINLSPQTQQIQLPEQNQPTEEKHEEVVGIVNSREAEGPIEIEEKQASHNNQQILDKQQVRIKTDQLQVQQQPNTSLADETISEKIEAKEAPAQNSQIIEEKAAVQVEREKQDQFVSMAEDIQIIPNQQAVQPQGHPQDGEAHLATQQKVAETSEVIKEQSNPSKNEQHRPKQHPLIIKEVERKEVVRQAVQTQKPVRNAEPQPIRQQEKLAAAEQKKVVVPEQQNNAKKTRMQMESERPLIQSFRQKPKREQKNGGQPKGCQACEIM